MRGWTEDVSGPALRPGPEPLGGGGGACWLRPLNTGPAEGNRPIRQVTIKHFIFVKFFMFMISKKNKD